jgi:ABC-type transport system involved in multi-copper enzyme maturation permease subunit
MNWTLFRQTWRFQRVRLALVAIALAVWGFLLPIIYARFGSQFSALMNSGLLPEQFAKFGGGDVFSLSGSIALSFIHPIAIILTSVFAVGFSSAAIAGERQRGTLEVALARPVSRQAVYVTLLAASFAFVGTTVAALLAGGVGGSVFAGVAGELAFEHLPLLWLNGVLLFGAFAAIGLAASVSFDRLPPAMGWALGVVIAMYVMQVLGSLWPAAEKLQPYSLFYYLKPKAILTGAAEPVDLAVLAIVTAIAMGWALVVFPRRDLAAPS